MLTEDKNEQDDDSHTTLGDNSEALLLSPSFSRQSSSTLLSPATQTLNTLINSQSNWMLTSLSEIKNNEKENKVLLPRKTKIEVDSAQDSNIPSQLNKSYSCHLWKGLDDNEKENSTISKNFRVSPTSLPQTQGLLDRIASFETQFQSVDNSHVKNISKSEISKQLNAPCMLKTEISRSKIESTCNVGNHSNLANIGETKSRKRSRSRFVSDSPLISNNVEDSDHSTFKSKIPSQECEECQATNIALEKISINNELLSMKSEDFAKNITTEAKNSKSKGITTTQLLNSEEFLIDSSNSDSIQDQISKISQGFLFVETMLQGPVLYCKVCQSEGGTLSPASHHFRCPKNPNFDEIRFRRMIEGCNLGCIHCRDALKNGYSKIRNDACVLNSKKASRPISQPNSNGKYNDLPIPNSSQNTIFCEELTHRNLAVTLCKGNDTDSFQRKHTVEGKIRTLQDKKGGRSTCLGKRKRKKKRAHSFLQEQFCYACQRLKGPHHQLCRHHPRFDNSGAKEVLELLLAGISVGCQGCKVAYTTGTIPFGLKHSNECPRYGRNGRRKRHSRAAHLRFSQASSKNESDYLCNEITDTRMVKTNSGTSDKCIVVKVVISETIIACMKADKISATKLSLLNSLQANSSTSIKHQEEFIGNSRNVFPENQRKENANTKPLNAVTLDADHEVLRLSQEVTSKPRKLPLTTNALLDSNECEKNGLDANNLTDDIQCKEICDSLADEIIDKKSDTSTKQEILIANHRFEFDNIDLDANNLADDVQCKEICDKLAGETKAKETDTSAKKEFLNTNQRVAKFDSKFNDDLSENNQTLVKKNAKATNSFSLDDSSTKKANRRLLNSATLQSKSLNQPFSNILSLKAETRLGSTFDKDPSKASIDRPGTKSMALEKKEEKSYRKKLGSFRPEGDNRLSPITMNSNCSTHSVSSKLDDSALKITSDKVTHDNVIVSWSKPKISDSAMHLGTDCEAIARRKEKILQLKSSTCSHGFRQKTSDSTGLEPELLIPPLGELSSTERDAALDTMSDQGKMPQTATYLARNDLQVPPKLRNTKIRDADKKNEIFLQLSQNPPSHQNMQANVDRELDQMSSFRTEFDSIFGKKSTKGKTHLHHECIQSLQSNSNVDDGKFINQGAETGERKKVCNLNRIDSESEGVAGNVQVDRDSCLYDNYKNPSKQKNQNSKESTLKLSQNNEEPLHMHRFRNDNSENKVHKTIPKKRQCQYRHENQTKFTESSPSQSHSIARKDREELKQKTRRWKMLHLPNDSTQFKKLCYSKNSNDNETKANHEKTLGVQAQISSNLLKMKEQFLNESVHIHDIRVPFCRACRESSMAHHTWCPSHPLFENSGARKKLERIRVGLRMCCDACDFEYENGQSAKSRINHSEPCNMRNRNRNKNSIDCSVKTKVSAREEKVEPFTLRNANFVHTPPQSEKKYEGITTAIQIDTLTPYQAEREYGETNTATKTETLDTAKIDCETASEAPVKPVWRASENPWGSLDMSDGDVVVSRKNTFTHHEVELKGMRFDLRPFRDGSDYDKTHIRPSVGVILLKLTRDPLACISWGVRFEIHDFGSACLVKSVDPNSPASQAKYVGSSEPCSLYVHDMILAINGKEVGGMTEVGLQIELETSGVELILAVSRYRFPNLISQMYAVRQNSIWFNLEEKIGDRRVVSWSELNLASDNQTIDDAALRSREITLIEGTPKRAHIPIFSSACNEDESPGILKHTSKTSHDANTMSRVDQCLASSESNKSSEETTFESENWEDDDDPWIGCVCGETHEVNVCMFWIQCDLCGTWLHVSSECVGFDEEEAKKLEKWICNVCS
jgi:hypothetical protein